MIRTIPRRGASSFTRLVSKRKKENCFLTTKIIGARENGAPSAGKNLDEKPVFNLEGGSSLLEWSLTTKGRVWDVKGVSSLPSLRSRPRGKGKEVSLSW